MKPDFYATDNVPPAEWDESTEVNFNTLQRRVYRRARLFIAAEAIDDHRVSVQFTFDASLLNGKSNAEIVALMDGRVLSAINGARECYVSWESKQRRCGCCGKRATEYLTSKYACCKHCSTHCRAPGQIDRSWYHDTLGDEGEC